MSPRVDLQFNRITGVSSIVGLVLAAIPLLRDVGKYAPTWTPFTTAERLDMLLHLSILTLIANALGWWGLEKIFAWNYGPGPRTPKGIAAAVLSLSLTVPAVTMPLLYQIATGKAVVSNNHLNGAILVLVGGTIAYVVLFGIDDVVFPGVRSALLHRFRQHPLAGEIAATFAYAFILIVLIATPYRLMVAPQSPPHIFLGRPALASLVTFFGVTAYILLKNPDSLRTKVWVHTRGIIATMFTAVSVCGALYA